MLVQERMFRSDISEGILVSSALLIPSIKRSLLVKFRKARQSLHELAAKAETGLIHWGNIRRNINERINVE
jgi:hypothetical protein